MKTKRFQNLGTLVKKNFTRFAPCWAICLVLQLLILSIDLFSPGVQPFILNFRALNPALLLMPYGILVALLLFGDLYDSRRCNALHAMPVSRHTQLMANLISGVGFYLLPSLAVGILACLITDPRAPGLWWVSLAWTGLANLQYLFFFGLGVFSALLAGSALGGTYIYLLLNFLPLLAYYLVDSLIVSLWYGIRLPITFFENLCPIFVLASMDMERDVFPGTKSLFPYLGEEMTQYHLRFGWEYLAFLGIFALVGIGFMALTMVLYRRRKLEVAGDFLAIPVAKPVVPVVLALVLGLALGPVWFVVGFFGGLMLTERSLRVFHWKKLLGFGGLVAAIVVIQVFAVLDPFGFQTRIPAPESVAQVQVRFSGSGIGSSILLEEEGDIETVLQLHGSALEMAEDTEDIIRHSLMEMTDYDNFSIEGTDYVSFRLEYTLASGGKLQRYYFASRDYRVWDELKALMSRTECVLGVPEAELTKLAQKISYGKIGSQMLPMEQENILSLLQAIAADCDEGHMAQLSGLNHPATRVVTITFRDRNDQRLLSVEVSSGSRHTLAWLAEHNVPID